MAFFFGLRVSRNLTDIIDDVESLKNLYLDVEDIAIFKGLTEEGVQRSDFRTLSGLDFDLEKIINSLKTETSKYDNLTSGFFDQNSAITSNLNINGQLGAGAIKYRFIDFADSNKVKTADISTSRVSSWSAFDNPLTPSSQIFYGGDVQVGGPLELTTLNISTAAQAKRFESEIPTHRIKVKIGNEDVYLYAMKGIPLTFKGFFRYCNISININSLYSVRPSWVIKNTAGGYEWVYENRLNGNLSNIVFSDTGARERDIQLYYPVAGIISLSMPAINLVELPPVSLPNLQTLDVNSNDFREMPNISQYTNLTTFNISYNDLTRSTDESPIPGISGTIAGAGTPVNTWWYETTVTCSTTGLEAGMLLTKTSGAGAFGGVTFIQSVGSGQITVRAESANTAGAIVFSAQKTLKSLTKQVVSRIPTTVQSLDIGNCYTGTVTGSFENFSNLKSFGMYSAPGRRSSGISPRVTNAIENYDIRYNFFNKIDKSVQQSTKLKNLWITDNRINDGNISIASPDFEYFESYYSNYINVIDVSNKTKLRTYISYSNGIIADPVNNPNGTNVTNKFDGCSALEGITLMYTYATGATGALPGFVGCTSLKSVDFYSTNIGNASPGFVITSSTFDSCRSTLQFFRIVSGAITGNAVIAPNALRNMKSLYYFAVSSGFNGLYGTLPSFASAPALQYVILYQNNLTGSIPDFSANPNIYYIDLRWNNFTGKVPDIQGSIFYYAYLADNNLTEFTTIGSTKLRVLQLSRNALPNIPYIGNLTLLNEFYFNDQKLGGAKVTYDSTNDNFAGLISIRYMDLSNNKMSQGDVNQIIKHLNKNYDSNPRSGVSINLRGNDSPSTETGEQVPNPEDDIPAIITKLRKAGWSIQIS